jgi:hypothetical protein
MNKKAPGSLRYKGEKKGGKMVLKQTHKPKKCLTCYTKKQHPKQNTKNEVQRASSHEIFAAKLAGTT